MTFNSVVNMFKPRERDQDQEQEQENFLCQGVSDTIILEQEANNFLDSIEDECYDPGSPGYILLTQVFTLFSVISI